MDIKKTAKVCLIGRTNVGKSTIFNKLTEEKNAIASKIAGTTRDQKEGLCLWEGRSFLLYDTAGLDVSSDKPVDIKSIAKAKKTAMDADLILFVVDAKDGLLPGDKEFADYVKKTGKPTILLINKVDGDKQMNELTESMKLGFKKFEAISAVTGAGTGDLLDLVLKELKSKAKKYTEDKKRIINIAIIGKPNVGKSSLINSLSGEDKSIVSEIAHTTRDSQNFELAIKNKNQDIVLNFVDTAGIRRKSKIDNRIEKESVAQSLSAIHKAEIVLLMIDAMNEITHQDKSITQEIMEQGKSVIFVVNKWDLVKDKDTHIDKQFTNFVYKSFPYLTWAPIVFISAKTGEKTSKLLNLIIETHEKQHIQITEDQLKTFVKYLVRRQSPRKTKGTKPPYIHAIKQTKTNPQTFQIIADQADNIHFSYIRFIKNELRAKFNLDGIGLTLFATEKTHRKSHTNY